MTPSSSSIDPDRIEDDLDKTRSRLGSHLDALQDKLSPGQVVDDLMGYFRGSEGAEFGKSLLDNVRGNPMPAAITAIGLAWLMASKPISTAGAPLGSSSLGASRAPASPSSGPHLYGREDYAAVLVRVREAEASTLKEPGEADHLYSARQDEVRGQAMGLARHAQETTQAFGQRVQDALAAAQHALGGKANDLAGKAGDAMSGVGDAAGALGSSAQGAVESALGALSRGGEAGSNLASTISQNPVLLGALGLAAGALLGALLPVSEQEEAALGGVAGQAREAVTGLAHQGFESGKAVAEAVRNQAKSSADGHGFTESKTPGALVDAALSGELAGHAKGVLQEVLQTGEEAVRREVEPPASGGQRDT